jgi:hypothetical protein
MQKEMFATLGILATLVAVTIGTTTTKISYIYGSEDQADKQDRSLAKIIIEKEGNLGPQDAGDFEAEVTGNHPSPTQVNLGTDEIDRTITIRPGSYNVHEVGESGGTLEDRPDFDVEYSEDCSGTVKPRTTITCTITNDFTGPQ